MILTSSPRCTVDFFCPEKLSLTRSSRIQPVRFELLVSDTRWQCMAGLNVLPPEAAEPARQPGEPPFPGMVWIPGGTFRMGSDDHYPEEAPAHRVTVDGFWMDRTPVTNAQFGASSTRPATSRLPSVRPTRRTIPARCPDLLVRRLARCSSSRAGRVDLNAYNWWTYVRGRGLASSARPGQFPRRARRPPGRTRRLRGRGSLRALGGQGAADRGRMGVRRARRAGRARTTPGATSSRPDGQPHGQHLAGRVPLAEPAQDGYERTSPVGAFPPNGYGLLRHDRQRVGVDHGLVSAAPRRTAKACCTAEQSARRPTRSQSYDPAQPEIRSRGR